jgi:hypothetical protein
MALPPGVKVLATLPHLPGGLYTFGLAIEGYLMKDAGKRE